MAESAAAMATPATELPESDTAPEPEPLPEPPVLLLPPPVLDGPGAGALRRVAGAAEVLARGPDGAERRGVP